MFEFIKNKFPEQKIEHPLFYSWATGIRFETGGDDVDDKIKKFENALFKIKSLFRYIFKSKRKLICVIKSFSLKSDLSITNNLKKAGFQIPESSVFELIQEKVIDEEDGFFRGFNSFLTLEIPNNYDLILPVIKNIAGYKAGLNKNYGLEIYIVGLEKDNITVFSPYDYRGLDIVSTDKEKLKDMFVNFNSWVLPYDYENIKLSLF